MTASSKLGQLKHRSTNLGDERTNRAIMFLQSAMEAVVEKAYWLRRQREELALADTTTCVEAKLIHLDLAGRYSVKAAGERTLAQHCE